MSLTPALYEEAAAAPLQGLVSAALLTLNYRPIAQWGSALLLCWWLQSSPKALEREANPCLAFLCVQVYNLTAFLMAWDRGHMSGGAI